MAEPGACFREVTISLQPDSAVKKFNVSIDLSSGESRSVKQAEFAGGYVYKENYKTDSVLFNRFIKWHCDGSILNLWEQSLDVDLEQNSISVNFEGATVLNGLSVFESHSHVIILVPTTHSVHRLLFKHSLQMPKHKAISLFNGVTANIFARSVITTLSLGQTGISYPMLHAATSILAANDEALFAMASSNSSIFLVTLPPPSKKGSVLVSELKQSSLMERMWGNFTASKSNQSTTCDLCALNTTEGVLLMSVCFDYKIRIWSVKRETCISVINVLDFVTGNIDVNSIGACTSGSIRCINTRQGKHLLVYVPLIGGSQFAIFDPVIVEGRYQLSPISIIPGPDHRLIDWQPTLTDLVSIWTDSSGKTVSLIIPLESSVTSEEQWSSVELQTPQTVVEYASFYEPRQIYMDAIFESGDFSQFSIQQALDVFRRSLDPTPSAVVMSWDILRAEATQAVENEIRSLDHVSEMEEEEFLGLQKQHWQRLHNLCLKYQRQAGQPLGILVDTNGNSIYFLKKGELSVVRACQPVEQIFLTSSSHISQVEMLLKDTDVPGAELMAVLECLNLVNVCLTPDMKFAFYQDVYHAQCPEVLSGHIVNALSLSEDVAESLQMNLLHSALDTLVDPLQSIALVLHNLDFSRQSQDSANDSISDKMKFFCSRLGMHYIAGSLRQYADVCFQLCRNLLILQTMICNVTAGDAMLQREFIAQTAKLTRAYFLILWVCSSPSAVVSTTVHDLASRHVDILGLKKLQVVSSTSEGGQPISLLFLLLQADRVNSVESGDYSDVWGKCEAILSLMWPLSSCTFLPHMLWAQGQAMALLEYTRLTCEWCEWNISTFKFLQGIGYLLAGETEKSKLCMIESVEGASSEEFLCQITDDNSESEKSVNFILKIIQLLEEFGEHHNIILLAHVAIGKANSDNPNLPTLWSIIFKNQLEISHIMDAYAAILDNPDVTRRRDCLRQFLVVLCEKNKLQELVELSYIDMEDDVVAILESRARSVDLATHNYYHLLYAFHLFRGNYRKAASIMYECGLRLSIEVPGEKSINRQAQSFLSALNALRLIEADYAWLVRPVLPTESQNDFGVKHSYDGLEIKESKNRSIRIVKLSELEKEYHLVHCRSLLISKDAAKSSINGPTPGPSEMLALLVNARQFDEALHFCKVFELNEEIVIAGLASQCIKLSQLTSNHVRLDNEKTAEAWGWLRGNKLRSEPLYLHHLTAVDQAWKMLRSFVESESGPSCHGYKVVVNKLLSHRFPLPDWLMEGYKRQNVAQFLRTLIVHDQLQLATSISLELIDAAMGKGPEYFNLEALHFKSSGTLLPYTMLDQLLYLLQNIQTNRDCPLGLTEMKRKLSDYFKFAEAVSKDITQTMTKLCV